MAGRSWPVDAALHADFARGRMLPFGERAERRSADVGEHQSADAVPPASTATSRTAACPPTPPGETDRPAPSGGVGEDQIGAGRPAGEPEELRRPDPRAAGAPDQVPDGRVAGVDHCARGRMLRSPRRRGHVRLKPVGLRTPPPPSLGVVDLHHRAQVLTEFLERWATDEPATVVDLVDHEIRPH